MTTKYSFPFLTEPIFAVRFSELCVCDRSISVRTFTSVTYKGISLSFFLLFPITLFTDCQSENRLVQMLLF